MCNEIHAPCGIVWARGASNSLYIRPKPNTHPIAACPHSTSLAGLVPHTAPFSAEPRQRNLAWPRGRKQLHCMQRTRRTLRACTQHTCTMAVNFTDSTLPRNGLHRDTRHIMCAHGGQHDGEIKGPGEPDERPCLAGCIQNTRPRPAGQAATALRTGQLPGKTLGALLGNSAAQVWNPKSRCFVWRA